MIFYYGSLDESGPAEDDLFRNRHILVSFFYPSSIEAAKLLSSTYILDNGAFSHWTREGKKADVDKYYDWVRDNTQQNLDWALIPDVIDGTIEENDLLISTSRIPRDFATPVYHMAEPLHRLRSLLDSYRVVAIGSSGEYKSPGSDLWFSRMDEIMNVCEQRVGSKVHGLRMLNPKIWTQFPFHSVDSSTLARNWKKEPGGIHRMLRRIENNLPKRKLDLEQKGLFDEV